jgi:hypothetical protein
VGANRRIYWRGGVTRPFLPILPDIVEIGLKPLFHPWHNDRPIGQQHDKEHILDWTFNRIRKANESERDRICPKFLRFQCADLYLIKGRHKIGSNFSRFFFRYGVGRILLTVSNTYSNVPPSLAAPR